MLYFETCGNGYWSNKATEVTIERIQLCYVNDNKDFGEVKVYFSTADWDVETDGLIYTDSLFMKQLQKYCKEHYGTDDIGYSEQGMQGDGTEGENFVSCDVGADFISKFKQLVEEF